MPTLPFVTVDVFTSTRYAGNPLAIVLLPPEAASPLSTAQMQRIADEFNLSETVFLHAGSLSPDDASSAAAAAAAAAAAVDNANASADTLLLQWRVRIFMVGRELPFAGHPTIGTVCYALSQQQASRGRLLCNAGPIDVALDPAGHARAVIPHNVHVHTEFPFGVADVLALQPALADVGLDDAAIRVVSPVLGMNFVTVEVPTLDALARVTTGPKPRPQLDRAWDVGFAGAYYYVVAAAGEGKIRSRMIEGRMEDPATGSAACALSAYLALNAAASKGRTQAFEITQGVEMGRESLIGVEVTLTESLDAVETLILRGTAVKVMEGTVEY